jgi:hypothetical protein
MTVAAQTPHNTIVASLNQAVFPFTFRADSDGVLNVYINDVLQGGYGIARNADQIAAPGGTITLAAQPAGAVIEIERVSPQTQATAFPAAYVNTTTETALDKVVLWVQEIYDLVTRTWRVTRANLAKLSTLDMPAPVLNRLIGWIDAGGGLFKLGNLDPAVIGLQGPVGPAGAAGAQGIQGIQGVQGNAGAQGAQGNAGAQGAQGIQGPAGPASTVDPTTTYNFTRKQTIAPSVSEDALVLTGNAVGGTPLNITPTNTVRAHARLNPVAADPSALADGDIWVAGAGASMHASVRVNAEVRDIQGEGLITDGTAGGYTLQRADLGKTILLTNGNGALIIGAAFAALKGSVSVLAPSGVNGAGGAGHGLKFTGITPKAFTPGVAYDPNAGGTKNIELNVFAAVTLVFDGAAGCTVFGTGINIH